MSAYQVFAVDQQGSSKFSTMQKAAAQGVDFGYGLATVLTWIRETLVRGDMITNASLSANRKVIDMRQAVYQYNTRSQHCGYLDFNPVVIADLFSQFMLRQLRADEGDLFEFAHVLEQMQAMPGLYLLYFRNSTRSRGYAVGYRFNRGSHMDMFDPAKGLFRFGQEDRHTLILEHEDYLDFIGGEFWFKQLTLG